MSQIPLDPDKAREWGKRWRQKFAPDSGSTFLVAHGRTRARVLNFDHPSVKVILDLEMQINGRVLSPAPKETP